MKLYPFILSLFCLCVFSSSSPSVSSAVSFKHYKDDKIQLEYPASWNVMKKDNVITFKTIKGKEVLSMQVISANFDVAADEAGFVKVGMDWRLSGRHDMQGEADKISNNGWRGLTGEAPVGTSEGLAFAIVTMISDDKTSAIFTGEVMGSDEWDKIFKTVRFKRR